MPSDSPNELRARVTRAAEQLLTRSGSVGPLELLLQMGLLQPRHVEQWRKGHPADTALLSHLQLGPEKWARIRRYFAAWAQEQRLQATEAAYTRRTVQGVVPLQFSTDGAPELEQYFRTHYVRADLKAHRSQQLAAKLNKVPDLVVHQTTGADGACSECRELLPAGCLIALENQLSLCLSCADLDQLVFLPAGDTALSRRSRKYSALAAVVVRFNRSRRRYERQGLLVSPAALQRAEEECASDAPERAAARTRAAQQRGAEDQRYAETFTGLILERFPGCPAEEAGAIAAHTALRGSGRVGRSAGARALESEAIDLAVIAHIRHAHTPYDQMLMRGTPRLEARALIRPRIDEVLERWRQR